MISILLYKVKILFKKLRKKKFIYIDSNENLENCIEAICKDELLGIDTEFLWRNTYYPILSLVQINSGTNIYIVDCIKINNIKLLNKILEDVKIIKVFHSLRGDVSVLKHALDSKIVNVLDTQIAEQLIQNSVNVNQVSYKNLVKKYISIDINKKETNSNWLKRPLNKSQLNYASDDVEHLLYIIKKQIKVIGKKGLSLEFEKRCLEEKRIAETEFSIIRLNRYKKNKKMTDSEKKLFLWREEIAKRNDIPPNKVFHAKHLKIILKIINDKKFKELDWIFSTENIKKEFINDFA